MKKRESDRRPPAPVFSFRNEDIVGANDAEEDERWLERCFVDTGQIAALEDLKNPKRIVLGRTGTGKSALLAMLQKRLQRVVSLDPAKLSLSYVSNAPILRVLREAGVNLEFFYKLLWRHCFCVELLRLRFPNQGTFANLADRLTSKESRRALDYLKKYGDTFFEQSDVRTQTLVKTVEEKVGSEVGATFAGASAKVMSGGQLTLEERSEIARKAQTVLPEQLRQELADILELVAAVLDDHQKPQYILVDRIDENWVAEEAKLPLIMALIETVKDFRKVSNAKIIVATRVDLLRRVFDVCHGQGFQEEKFESLYLRLGWSRSQLVTLLDNRVNFTFRERYARQLKTVDIFQADAKYFKPIDFIFDRTLQRPRDVIALLNSCIQASNGRDRITKQLAETAERNYSESRLRSLRHEWHDTFACVDTVARVLLDKQTSTFRVGDLQSAAVRDRCADEEIAGKEPFPDGLVAAARSEADARLFIRKGLSILCHVGAIGLKLRTDEPSCSGPDHRLEVLSAGLTDETRAEIHPMLWKTLHVRSAQH